MTYSREYYCYYANAGVPPIPPLENQDTLLMDSPTYRSDKVGSCAKASMGRGFKYFALFNNGKCLSSWDATTTYNDYGYKRSTRQYCYYYCNWGCYSRCYSYLIQCGNGYGDSTKMNVYTLNGKLQPWMSKMFFCCFVVVVFSFFSREKLNSTNVE